MCGILFISISVFLVRHCARLNPARFARSSPRVCNRPILRVPQGALRVAMPALISSARIIAGSKASGI